MAYTILQGNYSAYFTNCGELSQIITTLNVPAKISKHYDPIDLCIVTRSPCHQACAQVRAGAFKCKCKRRIKCKCSASEPNASANAQQPNQNAFESNANGFISNANVFLLLFCLSDDSVFYVYPDRLRLPLIFYYGHTACVYINKLVLAGLIKVILGRHPPRFIVIFSQDRSVNHALLSP